MGDWGREENGVRVKRKENDGLERKGNLKMEKRKSVSLSCIAGTFL